VITSINVVLQIVKKKFGTSHIEYAELQLIRRFVYHFLENNMMLQNHTYDPLLYSLRNTVPTMQAF